MCPDDILNWAWRQFERLCYEGKCGECEKSISVEDIIKLGMPTKDEEEFISIVVSLNYCESIGARPCSKCMTYCVRRDTSDIQVKCIVCTKKDGINYWFCWNCDRRWNNLHSHTVCGNANCSREIIQKLEVCEEVKFTDSKGRVITTPRERACPNCKTLLHYLDLCNEMICSKCHFIFCFICLQPAKEGSLVCRVVDNDFICTPAPRQTRL